ncbi:MAG: hypothetical protein MMC33_004510 [Icmadophila ericetorum]|nr:hypothetical protein [Icmadophila ericetorum]
MDSAEAPREDALQAIPPNGTRIGDPELISRIEEIFTTLVENLQRKEPLSISINTRRQDPGTAAPTVISRQLTFPGPSPEVALRFTRILRILEFVHEALVTGTIITKREVYYRDPALFVHQGTVDRCIDDLAFTFGVRRAALNVVAAAKGLIAGTFTITRTDRTILDYASEAEGLLVPNVDDIASIDLTNVSWILVIEKEATFRSLAISKFYRNRILGNGIILTVILPQQIYKHTLTRIQAKGYPDISTRAFLHTMTASALSSPHPPRSFALVDYDPDGLSILSTYKHGSASLAHENAHLICPELRWLGPKSCDLSPAHDDEVGLLELSIRDKKKAAKMLEKEILRKEAEWRKEIQVMLMLGFKAEIQLMCGRRGGLESWLEQRLQDQLRP